MNQYPTIDRWYAITILCFNVVFPVVTIFAARSAAKTEADAPEVLRKHHRVLLWAHIAGFTLIATVPAVLTWAGLLPSVGTMGVRLFDFVTEGWKRQAGLTGFALAVSGVLTKNTICLDCGFVEISCDPEAAKALVKKIEDGK